MVSKYGKSLTWIIIWCKDPLNDYCSIGDDGKMGGETQKKMRSLVLSELQAKITDLENQYTNIHNQFKSILFQQFESIQQNPVSNKKAPWWVEEPNLTEEEEYLNVMYLKWCTIKPFSDELQNAARTFQLFNPKLTQDACINKNVMQPLHIQFFFDQNFDIIIVWNNSPIAKFTRYSTNLKESFKINFTQVLYDKVSFVKQCKKYGFTSNGSSVKLEEDFKNLFSNCGTFSNYIGRDQNLIKS